MIAIFMKAFLGANNNHKNDLHHFTKKEAEAHRGYSLPKVI